MELKNIEKILKRVERPGRYMGNELNICKKDPEAVRVRFGFCFPDTYEIGMSYLGLQILYGLLNRQEDIYCERLFAPAPDMEEEMRKEGLPLFTLETGTPARDLDIVGFTLQYELSYSNVLNMLSLSEIPLLREEREKIYEETGRVFPLIIAGGPCAFNPEPLADFVDIFLLGDGEEILPDLCKLYGDWKGSGEPLIAFLKAASQLTGVYVPKFYDIVYGENGLIKEIVKTEASAPDIVEKALIPEIEAVYFPVAPIIPYVEVVHDRSVVESFRGCTRGCRFCQAGMIYRPVRERSHEKIRDLALEQLQNSGHEELSLLSLSTSDHSQFEALALNLMSLCREQNVSLSLPSLRLDSFSFKVLQEIQGYKKSGLTFAPEAGTQRLRDVINKGITEEHIYSAVRQALELGWSTIKLYFMVGLPTETFEDLDGIVNITKEILNINREVSGSRAGRFKLTVSVSNFVPKAHTPFQWAAQDSPEQFTEKHMYLKDMLKMRGVVFQYHGTATSGLEAVFARGDRRVGKVLLAAHKFGCRFDGWTEHFNASLWNEAFEITGIDREFYAQRERNYDEILPWAHLSSSVSLSFLKEENERAKAAAVTEDCRTGCKACGIQKRTVCSSTKEAIQI